MKFQADVQESQLTVALREWLTGSSSLLVLPCDIDSSEVPYAMRPARFYSHVLLVLGNENISEIAALFEAAWDCWKVMSKAQQTHWEELYLLTCAYAQANACLPPHLSGWHAQMKALNTRRNGSLPHWILRVAQLKGFTLGIQT